MSVCGGDSLGGVSISSGEESSSSDAESGGSECYLHSSFPTQESLESQSQTCQADCSSQTSKATSDFTPLPSINPGVSWPLSAVKSVSAGGVMPTLSAHEGSGGGPQLLMPPSLQQSLSLPSCILHSASWEDSILERFQLLASRNSWGVDASAAPGRMLWKPPCSHPSSSQEDMFSRPRSDQEPLPTDAVDEGEGTLMKLVQGCVGGGGGVGGVGGGTSIGSGIAADEQLSTATMRGTGGPGGTSVSTVSTPSATTAGFPVEPPPLSPAGRQGIGTRMISASPTLMELQRSGSMGSTIPASTISTTSWSSAGPSLSCRAGTAMSLTAATMSEGRMGVETVPGGSSIMSGSVGLSGLGSQESGNSPGGADVIVSGRPAGTAPMPLTTSTWASASTQPPHIMSVLSSMPQLGLGGHPSHVSNPAQAPKWKHPPPGAVREDYVGAIPVELGGTVAALAMGSTIAGGALPPMPHPDWGMAAAIPLSTKQIDKGGGDGQARGSLLGKRGRMMSGIEDLEAKSSEKRLLPSTATAAALQSSLLGQQHMLPAALQAVQASPQSVFSAEIAVQQAQHRQAQQRHELEQKVLQGSPFTAGPALPSAEGNIGQSHITSILSSMAAGTMGGTSLTGAAGFFEQHMKPRARARRGQATDPHSIAERMRRERIAERMKSLQDLVPNANKTDKASMLDEIIDYVKFLQLQVKILSMSRGGAESRSLIADLPFEGLATKTTAALAARAMQSGFQGSGLAVGLLSGGSQSAAAQGGCGIITHDELLLMEQHVASIMNEDVGTAMQTLHGKGLCLVPLSVATAIHTGSIPLRAMGGGPSPPALSGQAQAAAAESHDPASLHPEVGGLGIHPSGGLSRPQPAESGPNNDTSSSDEEGGEGVGTLSTSSRRPAGAAAMAGGSTVLGSSSYRPTGGPTSGGGGGGPAGSLGYIGAGGPESCGGAVTGLGILPDTLHTSPMPSGGAAVPDAALIPLGASFSGVQRKHTPQMQATAQVQPQQGPPPQQQTQQQDKISFESELDPMLHRPPSKD